MDINEFTVEEQRREPGQAEPFFGVHKTEFWEGWCLNEEEKVRGKPCQREKSLQRFQPWGRDIFGVMGGQWGILHSQAPRGAGGRRLWMADCVGYLSMMCGQRGTGCLAINVGTSVDAREVHRLLVMSHSASASITCENSGSSIFHSTPMLTSIGVLVALLPTFCSGKIIGDASCILRRINFL